jgi:aerobic-type carbon monoxide dehydrogenase small subunit (CoxS/CutS family)
MTRSVPSEHVEVTFRVNGRDVTVHAQARTLLVDLLRDVLGLTGTHVGCEHGVCGACTILMDGSPVRSCLMLAPQAEGSVITTVEGLAEPGSLTPLQRAFWEHHALQCAFCTSGLLISATALLDTTPAPSDAEILEVVSGHICRCTGYEPIISAIRDAARKRKTDAYG